MLSSKNNAFSISHNEKLSYKSLKLSFHVVCRFTREKSDLTEKKKNRIFISTNTAIFAILRYLQDMTNNMVIVWTIVEHI